MKKLKLLESIVGSGVPPGTPETKVIKPGLELKAFKNIYPLNSSTEASKMKPGKKKDMRS